MQTTTITINAAIKADIATVWNAWTLPDHITKWSFASDDWHCPSATNDVRVGGAFRSRMEAKDGSFGFDFEGIYSDVQLHKTIAYTMPDGRRVVTGFDAANGTTNVTTTFDAEAENPAEMQQAGWQAILNNFKQYTETLK